MRPLLSPRLAACLAFTLGFQAVLAHGHASSAPPPDPARQAVRAFLAWEEKVRPSGARDADLGEPLPQLVSAELLCLLRAASAANDLSRRTAPGDKPPFVEGHLFLPSAWERPAGWALGSVKRRADEARVQVRFRYAGGAQRFTSTYFVDTASRPPRITDIDRGGTCDFCQSGRLTTALREALKDFPAAGAGACTTAR